MITEHYPYLLGNLIAFPVLAAAYLAAGPQRPAMIASGLLSAPWGALSLIVADYWSPVRLGGMPLGIEDLAFAFQTGASAWFWGSLPFRHDLVVRLRVGPMLVRVLGLAALFLAGTGLLWSFGISALAGTIIVPTGIAAILLAQRPQFWRVALAAGIGFACTYALLLSAELALLPRLAQAWHANMAWTTPVLGLPIGEVVWALTTAPAHVICFAFAARAGFAEPGACAGRQRQMGSPAR